MSNSKSNKISILIAVVAVVLILGGVYLLNESFNTSNDSNSSSDDSGESRSITYSVIDEDADDSDDNNSVELFSESTTNKDLSKDSDVLEKEADNKTSGATTNPVESEDLDKDSDNEKVAESDKESTEKESEKTDEDSDDSSKENKTETVTLEDNQVLVKIVSTDGFNSEVEITECGIPNATICIPGGELQLRALQEYTDIEEGKSYVLTGQIYEADGYIYVDTLDTVESI